jgi:5-methylcytosine-specific restriction enzyme A
LIQELGERLQYSFQIGYSYTRRDIYRVIGIPEDTHGGVWDTGYARHENDWFIFCNIATPGTTGHDYANQWIGDKLEWYGKTNSQLRHQSIQSILSVETNTYIFWREDNKKPFTFAGIGSVEGFEDTTPVKVIWTFEAGIFPDEINLTSVLHEGAVCQVSVNSFERNPLARQICLEHYGTSCCVCGFNFGRVFGELGEGFIHVHHLRQLSEIGKEYIVDPVKDLRPVCPNCHAMIHRNSVPLSIQEIKALVEETSSDAT